MSDTQINVGMNVDGVVTGTEKAKRSLKDLGTSAATAGSAVGNMGDGGAKSADKVEAATRSMVNSIQRQIAAAEAGDKSSRKYQESLAAIRGVDSNALKPYLDQLDAAKLKQSEALKSQDSMSAGFGALKIGALAAAAAIGAMAVAFKGIVDGIDKLNDLRDATGSTIENISALEDVALRTGTSFDTVASSLVKFNMVLKDSKAGSDSAAAFDKIGISVSELKALDPAEALLKVSKAFATFADDGNKARIMQELFGKSTRDVAAYLKDLADKGKLVATVTTKEADEAERLNKEFFAMQKNVADLARNIAGPLVTAFNEFIKKQKEAREAGKFGLFTSLQDMEDANNKKKSANYTGSWYSGDGGRGSVNPDFVKPSVGELPDQAKLKAAAAAAKKALEDQNKELAEQAKLLATLAGLTGSFSEDWARLGAVYAAGKISVEQLTAAQADLLTKQPAIKAQFDEQKKAIESAAKAYEDATNAERKYYAELSKDNAALENANRKLEEETALIGLTDDAKSALILTRMDNAIRIEEEGAALLNLQNSSEKEIETVKERIKLMKEQRELTGKRDTANAGVSAAKEVNAEWMRGWQETDRLSREVFTMWATDGGNAAQKIGDTLKKALLSAIYEATLKPIVFQIYGSIMGGGGGVGGTAAQVASSAGGSSGLLGGVGSAFGAFGAGANYGLQSLFANGFGTTMTAGSQMIGAGSYAAGLGTMAGAVAPFLAGIAVIKSLADYKITPNGNAIIANVGAGGASAVAARSDFAQTSSGIFSGGNTQNSSWAEADASTKKYIDENVKAITEASRAYGDAMGLSSAALDAYTAQLTINTTGMDAAAAKAAIDAELTKFAADQASSAYGDAIKQFAKDGETASQTLARLGTDLTAVNQWAALFGTTLYDVSVIGAASASALVTAFGSLENMNAALDSYYKNYYTQAEQDANTYLQIQADLAKAGIDISIDDLKNATKEGVRAYVEAARLMMLAGQITEEQFAAILNNANRAAPIIGRDQAPTPAEQGAEYEKARHDWAVQHPWEDAAGDFLNKDGTVTKGGLWTGSGGGAGGASIGGAGSSADTWKDGIKTWLEKLNSSDAGGLNIFKQRDNAWADFKTQLSLAQGGDATALGNITGYADSYIAAIKNTAKTSMEEQLAIARAKASVSGLVDPVKPEKLITDAVIKSGDGIVTAIRELNNQLTGGGGGGIGGSISLTPTLSQTQQNRDVVNEIRQLRSDFSAMSSHMESIAGSSDKTAKTLVRVTLDGEAMQSQAVI